MEDQQPATSGSGHDASVRPDAPLAAAHDRDLNEVREVRRQWAARMPGREAWERSLPVDPRLKYLADRPTRRSVFGCASSRPIRVGDCPGWAKPALKLSPTE